MPFNIVWSCVSAHLFNWSKWNHAFNDLFSCYRNRNFILACWRRSSLKGSLGCLCLALDTGSGLNVLWRSNYLELGYVKLSLLIFGLFVIKKTPHFWEFAMYYWYGHFPKIPKVLCDIVKNHTFIGKVWRSSRVTSE